MSDHNALDGLENLGHSGDKFGNFGEGPTERETRQAIKEIEETKPITGARRTIKQIAISLAMSIDKGNAKGRAIANEASQLFVMMRELSPPEEEASDDPSNLTEPTRRLLDGYASPPRLDPAPQRDSA